MLGLVWGSQTLLRDTSLILGRQADSIGHGEIRGCWSDHPVNHYKAQNQNSDLEPAGILEHAASYCLRALAPTATCQLSVAGLPNLCSPQLRCHFLRDAFP